MIQFKISVIAAIGENREIGIDNKLLWHIPEDMHHFKTITLGHPVIMGRKTFDSIGKPLLGRINIVLTKDRDFKAENVLVAHTIEEAISMGESRDTQEIFFIGGGEIYHQAIKFADKLYLTVVEGSFEADTFFPDYDEFKKVLYKRQGQYKDLKYTFYELSKL
ncbi:hypothetical protein A3D05_00330 [Candidatus Gottesmanbacteria bacterium RIFCSPHIGHO2_02_FULL_40_24]|uniref:Dihydrofolate reductase n=1 Tax=Candidatus Gottesmanbacteria bacterium RIFCSPHIGHO2_01_FULL_40_15 TaxID=1798376 RepID=A0A1F5Z7G0_9BACT|nr:MAG: hypothetical protein A2777_01660 [Candidatus Gottesmanbacteria bacterium RIFCSPHIGHO2_01_FULL_40_15]OGG18194.1 MAG: hypothetical protein A3D05_00330 [Candidatus Gottesmanbacteria bacterium RIFCSPHIGHO2_02_FULL_40_24]OGG22864.1 MAG: hypothetical protein A3B48_00890 [Candidatus Gottesmanbacteria bacterium RIFCSPLOWO2_01_FULL_40_10]OGG23478.1 MAG: hypothetical protein A3E42_00410 [Candidatus Gottesmanbacteria bacterium RIFCSPHIGHO2_12_FULL_40_13]OGG32521.1 MAG: hypothetical protein A3I80_0